MDIDGGVREAQPGDRFAFRPGGTVYSISACGALAREDKDRRPVKERKRARRAMREKTLGVPK